MITREAWYREITADYYRIPESEARSVPISDVAKKWEQDDKLYDVDWTRGEYHIVVPLQILRRYREFDRGGKDALPGGESEEKVKQLKETLKEEGFRIPVHITVYKDGKLPVLTEGNHRLVAAEALGIPEIPVVFFFKQGDSRR